MKTVGKVVLLLALIPLVLPLGIIAIMLEPFFEIMLRRKNNDNSK